MISSSCNKLNPLTAAIQHKIIVIIFVERRKITVYFRNKSHLVAPVITLECMGPDIKDRGIPQVEPLEDQELLAYTTRKEAE